MSDIVKCEDHDLPVDHSPECYIEFLELNISLYDTTLKVLIERAGGSIIIDTREVDAVRNPDTICVPYPSDTTDEVVWKIVNLEEDEDDNPNDEMRS